MIKYAVLCAAVATLTLAAAKPAVSPTGTWELDSHHSSAQLTTDGTTNNGSKKTDFTVGMARMNGSVRLDGENSKFDFRLYPASSMEPPISEEGTVKIEWFSNHGNNTLVCFHSKGAQQTADGKLKTTGTLVVTRVDRNVELTPSEAYAGPVYGPPIIHRVEHEATFVFDAPGGGDTAELKGSTNVVREDFPTLMKTVLATYWPPVVEDRKCEPLGQGNEGYNGVQCSGNFLMTMPLPDVPRATNQEDYPGQQGFNRLTGSRLTISVRMRLKPAGAAAAD
jgi:polyisoprenoid-binding protein YceI